MGQAIRVEASFQVERSCDPEGCYPCHHPPTVNVRVAGMVRWNPDTAECEVTEVELLQADNPLLGDDLTDAEKDEVAAPMLVDAWEVAVGKPRAAIEDAMIAALAQGKALWAWALLWNAADTLGWLLLVRHFQSLGPERFRVLVMELETARKGGKAVAA